MKKKSQFIKLSNYEHVSASEDESKTCLYLLYTIFS